MVVSDHHVELKTRSITDVYVGNDEFESRPTILEGLDQALVAHHTQHNLQ